MKTILRIILGLSLAANLWLGFGPPSQQRMVHTRSQARPPAVVAQPRSWLTGWDTAEPAALRDRLRAAGMDETTSRFVVTGVVRQRAADELAARQIDRARTAWWRSGRLAEAGDAKILQSMVTDPLSRLFDRSPFDQADAESHYLFLPPDKRRLLAQIDLDYADLQARLPRTTVGPMLASAVDQLQLLETERRKDVLAALTPGERAEYDLRFSGTAGDVAARMGAFDGTEAEYRTIKPIVDGFQEKSRDLGRSTPGFVDAYADLLSATMEQMVAQIGYDRAMAYISSGNDEAAINRTAKAAGLPDGTAGRVMQLAADIGMRASDIHMDASLTTEQKRAALIALQQSAQSRLDLVLPPDVQRQLPGETLPWLTGLAQGNYRMMLPSFTGSASFGAISVVAAPPPKRFTFPFLRSRSGGP